MPQWAGSCWYYLRFTGMYVCMHVCMYVNVYEYVVNHICTVLFVCVKYKMYVCMFVCNGEIFMCT